MTPKSKKLFSAGRGLPMSTGLLYTSSSAEPAACRSIDPDLVLTVRRHWAIHPIITTSLNPASSIVSWLRFVERGLERRRNRLGADRPAGAAGAGGFSARRADQGRRRLRQLRTRPAARRPEPQCPSRPSASGNTSSWARSGAAGHKNRMIKVPATPGGSARGGAVRGRRDAQRHADLLTAAVRRRPRRHLAQGASSGPRSTTSSRSTASSSAGSTSTPRSTCRQLSAAAQGMVGIVNAKRIWRLNQQFWADKKLPLKQEMIFASTGTKKPKTRRGSTSRRSPAPTSRPTRRRPTTPCRRAAGPSRAGRQAAAGRGAGRDRPRRWTSRSWKRR